MSRSVDPSNQQYYVNFDLSVIPFNKKLADSVINSPLCISLSNSWYGYDCLIVAQKQGQTSKGQVSVIDSQRTKEKWNLWLRSHWTFDTKRNKKGWNKCWCHKFNSYLLFLNPLFVIFTWMIILKIQKELLSSVEIK